MWLLWLLAAVPLCVLLFGWLLRWKKTTGKKIGDARLVKEMTRSFSPGRFLIKFILVTLALGLCIIAAMNLRRAGDADGINRKGIDVMIALDVSKSMLAADLAPNRLERARQFITRLMETMPNDRIGLVLFASKAYMQMPLTNDHGAAQLFVAAAGPDAVPQQGTVISEALKMSARAFDAQERRYKAVVLISDGEDHDEEAVKTARTLAEQGLMINTIGIGSPEGAQIPDPETGEPKKDEAGNTVISRLNEDELKEIASRTNGVYVRLQETASAVNEVKKQLSQIDQKAYADISLTNFKTYYWWFAAAALVLLLLEIFIPERKKLATA